MGEGERRREWGDAEKTVLDKLSRLWELLDERERKDINMKYHSAFYVNRKGYLILILGSCTYMVDMVDMIW